MSKTTQEKKAKKALEKNKVEETIQATEPQKAQEVEAVTTDLSIEQEAPPIKKVAKKRSKKYLAAKAKIDVNKYYSLTKAIELVKETSLSKFEGKIEAHVTVTEIASLGEINFPHLQSASKKVVILNDAILAEIKEGNLNFDILIATPVTMPKLLPLARVLGPKGLMPNPKNGTLTDKPEDSLKKLSVSKTVIKTEKKAPVVHIIVGKTSQKNEEIAANIEELIKTIKTNRIKKLVICATMGPSVKIEIK
jgi:large subunit ribosomal protein L1